MAVTATRMSRAAGLLQTLQPGLSEVFGEQVTILRRARNAYASTFGSELVTCRAERAGELRLLCKHGSSHTDAVYGHKGGVAYEARIYQEVLVPLEVTTPRYYGAFAEPGSDETWLILEYVDPSVRLSLSPPAAMIHSASWLGRFHAAAEARVSREALPWVTGYDTAYYVGWAARTSHFATGWHARFPWLADLCAGFEKLVQPLHDCPKTIVHGEYYPKNILVDGRSIYPIDWESAAVAAGEIDLASLTEGWPAAIARRCELAYRQARWPAGAPADFERALATARVYVHLRWLGDRPDWTGRKSALWHFRALHAHGRQLGAIS